MKQLLLIFAVILLDAMGCTRNREERDYIDVSPTEVFLSNQVGSSETFYISSNTRWTVSCSESWVSVSPISGSGDKEITVTALSTTESYYNRGRTCSIIIEDPSGSGYEVVKVFQEGVRSSE